MTDQHMKFDKVLVPIDGSAASQAAIDLALHSAKEFKPNLVFVYVIDVTSMNKFGTVDPSQEYYLAKIEGKMFLENASNLAEKAGTKYEAILAEGAPWEILNEMSKEADLMIMSVSGKGGMRAGRIGSTAMKVIEGSYCPVLTLKSTSNRMEKILLPVYEENRPAIDYAIQTAKRSSASVTVISVKEKNNDPQPLVDKITAEIKEAGVQVDSEVLDGNPVDVIVGMSGKFDLVVVGVDKRGGLHILHGGTTERIVTMAACPVTVVRDV